VSRRKRVRAAEGTLLAGWLFADLLLALSVVFLGVVPGPTTTTTTTTTATTTTTRPIAAEGLDITPVCLGSINTAQLRAADQQINWIQGQLGLIGAQGRRVGFLLLSGGGSGGIKTADDLVGVLKGAVDSPISAEFSFKPGLPQWAFQSTYNPGRDRGKVSVQAFFFTKLGAVAPKVDTPGCGSKDN